MELQGISIEHLQKPQQRWNVRWAMPEGAHEDTLEASLASVTIPRPLGACLDSAVKQGNSKEFAVRAETAAEHIVCELQSPDVFAA